jgi:hypothetical protein
MSRMERLGVCLKMAGNVLGLCVVALSKNLKLTTTLDRAITQNPCYVPFLFTKYQLKWKCQKKNF